MAFEVTQDDVANVLASNARAPQTGGTRSAEELAGEVFGQLDFSQIEEAALYGDDLDEQTEHAHDEIKRQLIEMGILVSETCARTESVRG